MCPGGGMRGGCAPADQSDKFFHPASMAFAAHNQERDLPLGELIVRAGLLSSVQLDAALAAARTTGRRLGEVLVDDELVDERELAQIVAAQEGPEFVHLGHP